jgi:DNA-binding transcriptional LysR family regulator
MTTDAASGAFRVAFVPGVTLGKWTRAWDDRRPDALAVLPTPESEQAAVLRDGLADVSFVRLPVDQDGLNVIPLYAELPVVVVGKDHPIEAAESVTLAELAALAGEPGGRMLAGQSLRDDLDLVAAGAGMLLLPQSVARLHARKDVVARPVTDAPETRIALAWLENSADDRVDEFVGIVRGRTARSSRATIAAPGQKEAVRKVPPKRPAQNAGSAQKAAAARVRLLKDRAQAKKRKRGGR